METLAPQEDRTYLIRVALERGLHSCHEGRLHIGQGALDICNGPESPLHTSFLQIRKAYRSRIDHNFSDQGYRTEVTQLPLLPVTL